MTVSVDRARFDTDLDLWSEEVLLSPYPHYDTLRDMGPAAYLTRYDVWILTRYEQVKSALSDWETFSSSHLGGMPLNAVGREILRGGALLLDPPEHGPSQKLVTDALRPRSIRGVLGSIEARCDAVVSELLEQSTFDGVTEFAHDLPKHVVMDLIGWPAHGRDQMIDWGKAIFTIIGPENQRLLDCLPQLAQAKQYLQEIAVEGNIAPDSFGASLFDAVRRGELAEEDVPLMLLGYLGPALDTTINGVGNLLWLLAEHPSQWALVHADPSLVRSAFLEALRLESPVQFFGRATTRDVDLGDGLVIPADSRVLLSYAAANRDPRHYPNPDRFDVRRNPTDTLSFGFGVHACAGRNLAMMEAESLFTALAKKVSTIELVGEPKRLVHNITRGLASLPVRIS